MKLPTNRIAQSRKGMTRGTVFANAMLTATLALVLSACQFQPLYTSDQGTVGAQSIALPSISVAEVNTRTEQQVRNHLIFLLSGGSNPVSPSHEIRLRVTDTTSVIASAVRNPELLNSFGNTAGSVEVTGSYEIYDFQKKEITHRGTRNARAAYDRTSQSFASNRAERDAQNRAARELAERLRFAIGSDLNRI